MNYSIKNNNYEVEIIKKNNKNTYIRVNNDLKIIVTTNYLMPNYKIKTLLDCNTKSLEKMISRQIDKTDFSKNFYYLGKKYDIIIIPTLKKVIKSDTKILVNSLNSLNDWLKKQMGMVFIERLNYIYNLFEETIPFPKLKIRDMKTRWGVCNKNNSITLNSQLIKYNITEIDYVITHELSHFLYFNHSKYFWNIVEKYCPNYKKNRVNLKR
ncbi:MAG: SprT family zinc-dependent metalloprotease [Bacilli bacterium]